MERPGTHDRNREVKTLKIARVKRLDADGKDQPLEGSKTLKKRVRDPLCLKVF